jgi:hypothetical protein
MVMSLLRTLPEMAFLVTGLVTSLVLASCGGAEAPAEVAARSAAVSTAVPLAATDARACDLVLDVGGDVVENVRFADGVAGSTFRRAPLLAVSLTSLTDVALPAEPFVIEAASALAPHPVTVRCVDRLGQPVAVATLAGAALAKDL